jgi:predicted PurR-regulated permease PerM
VSTTRDEIEIGNLPGEQRPARSFAWKIFALALIVGFLYIGRLFFVALVSAVLLAFILEPLVNLMMRARLPRGLSSFIASALMLTVLYLAGLMAWSQAVVLWEELPLYSSRIAALMDSATIRIELVEKAAQDLMVPKRLREEAAKAAKAAKAEEEAKKTRGVRRRPVEAPMPPPVQEVRIRQDESPLVSAVYEWLDRYSSSLLIASFVPFLVYFFLSWRDHFRRNFMNLVQGEQREIIQRAWDGIGRVARAYVVGNFLLGVLLSIITALFLYYVKVPYWQVVAPLSAFLSLVPYLGLPLSVLPPFLAMLPAYSGLPAYILVGAVVAFLHLLALNLLYPKLVGARVHLNPLVVTVAMMFWYLLWGVAGLVLAIPITAGMKAVFDSIPSLRGYGRLLGD